MNAEQKLSKHVFAVTIILMAAAFAYIPQFHEIEIHPITGILVGALTGTGLFEAIARFIELGFTKIKRVKRFILGSSYVEGQWVGFYENDSGEVRYVREFIRQDWSSMSINGQAFDVNNKPYGQWQSRSAIVNGDEGLLRATIVGDLRSGHYDSIIEYQLEGDPPGKRSGKIADIVTNVHAGSAWMRLIKIDDDDSEVKALAKAAAFYNEF
jgi:hypothetical protein